MKKTAVLLTCFNRKEYTLKCLQQLNTSGIEADIFLVDDCSTDGTSDVVKRQFPEINLIRSTGNLFWNRGMHLAWNEASKKNYDFYIWLNDDVFLYNGAFQELIDCSAQQNHQAIISGIVESEKEDCTLYGGTDGKAMIRPNGQMNSIHNLNGNIVLVPRCVFEQLGNLDPVYHHDLGDIDYGLRAKTMGIGVFTTRKAIASGTANNICRVRKNNTGLIQRFSKLYSPLGSHPGINFYFRKKHYGIIKATVFVLHLYILNILPDFAVRILYGNKYN